VGELLRFHSLLNNSSSNSNSNNNNNNNQRSERRKGVHARILNVLSFIVNASLVVNIAELIAIAPNAKIIVIMRFKELKQFQPFLSEIQTLLEQKLHINKKCKCNKINRII